jgi:hypothetical protein
MLEPDHFSLCEISHKCNRENKKIASGTHTWLHIPCFLKNNSKKNHKTFTTFQLGFYFEGKFLNSFSLFGQVLETCHHFMLNSSWDAHNYATLKN